MTHHEYENVMTVGGETLGILTLANTKGTIVTQMRKSEAARYVCLVVGRGEAVGFSQWKGIHFTRIMGRTESRWGKMAEKRAIFWTAWGEQHMEEARVSALSAKTQMPGITRVLYTRHKEKRRVKQVDPFNIIIAPSFGKLPSHRPEGLESLFYRVDAIDQLTDYYRLLFLDSDTYTCAPVYELFEALDRFDIMGVIAAGRVTRRTSVYIPEAYPELNGGVMAFRNNEKVRAFWHSCKDLYMENVHLYRRGNQGAIRESIWRDKSGLQVGVAPNEYCCRFPFGFWALGQVKILHGRANKLSFSRIVEVVNQVYPRMRAWGPGCFSEPHRGFRPVKLPYGGRGRLK